MRTWKKILDRYDRVAWNIEDNQNKVVVDEEMAGLLWAIIVKNMHDSLGHSM